jgi:hypothetical protein
VTRPVPEAPPAGPEPQQPAGRAPVRRSYVVPEAAPLARAG